MNNNNYTENKVKCFEGDGPFIFVSYSHPDAVDGDSSIVMRILRFLDKEGYCIWFDEGIRPATEFLDEIYSRIRTCGLFLALIDSKYKKSIWCGYELLTAYQLKKRILPIYLDNTGEPSFIKSVSSIQSINKYECPDDQTFFDKLRQTEDLEQFKRARTLSGEHALNFLERLENGDVPPEEAARIVSLDLSNKWIPYLPANIKLLTNLERLDLSSNALRRLPIELGYLTNLSYINLSSNSFFDFPIELTCLPKLVSLNIGSNFLKTFPKEISKLTCLKSLDFYRNWFVDFPPQVCYLENLTDLDASYNQYSSLPKEFSRLKKLERLDLNSTFIREIPEYFSQFDALVTLDLSYNQLTSRLPFRAIDKWIARDVYFREINAPYDKKMKIPAIHLFETVIPGDSREALLSNNLQRIKELY